MSELGKIVEQAQKSGTAEHTEAINSWKKRIRFGVAAITVAFLLWWVWIYILPDPSVAGDDGTPEFSFATMLLLLLVCLVAASVLPQKFSWIGLLLAGLLVVVILSDFSTGMNSFWESLTRGINQGDWSEPSDYVPRVDGGTFHVPAGQNRTADISGRVKIPIPAHHCLDIKGDFIVSWDGDISNAFITPKSGGVERVTIEALPAERCGNKS